MKVASRALLGAALSLSVAGCTPEWARRNSSPYILEIAGIRTADGSSTFLSDVSFPVVNDDALVTLNLFRKNNNPGLSTSAVEHVYLERYEVRYFRTDGRNQEGVDVPYRITGPLGNVRFHTPSAGGEVEIDAVITLVRHQAKTEPPLRNLQNSQDNFANTGVPGAQLPSAFVITTVAEITIHGRTVQGAVLEATGRVQVTFADFPDDEN